MEPQSQNRNSISTSNGPNEPTAGEDPRSILAAAQEIARRNPRKAALIDADGVETSYAELLQQSASLARAIRQRLAASGDVVAGRRPRVGFQLPATPAWVVAQWAIWRAGAMAVPLSPRLPPSECAYILDHARPALCLLDVDSGASLYSLAELAAARAIPTLLVDDAAKAESDSLLPAPAEDADDDTAIFSPEHDAMMLYTSGTTSKPKGVVTTHGNLLAQFRALTASWAMSQEDHALLVLPLHHVHGISNVLGCTLFAGGTVTMASTFDVDDVTRRLVDDESTITVFMAVPTIYRRLIRKVENDDTKDGAHEVGALEKSWRRAGDRMRLMVSGSAALPPTVFDRWRELTGHKLLERYGMTEIGMALSNPYDGERVATTVGSPLPTVAVRLVDDSSGERVVVTGDGAGEIEVAGPSVFRAYFDDDVETMRSRTEDGWFRTGDRGARQGDRYSILGRLSCDILKSGGEKISALEVEAVLLEHAAIDAVAVVGLPSEEWGDEVVAVVEFRDGAQLGTNEMRRFVGERLVAFKVPRRLIEHKLPRNALGKVQKRTLMTTLIN